MNQKEIDMWELEHFDRIVKWIKDFEKSQITFVLDDEKHGEQHIFSISEIDL